MLPRVRLFLCGCLLALSLFTPIGYSEAPADLCALSGVALKHASALRGLSIMKPVPCSVQDQKAVQAFIEATIKRDLAPQKLEMEQTAFRAIGMIPDDYDYAKSLVQFLVSQLGGYYDPREKRFVMAAWLPLVTQETVAVHELTHALQDQHYSLEKFLDPKSDTSDRSLAHSALIEGDATAVMFDNEKRQKGLPPLSAEKSIDSIILQEVLGMNVGGQGDVPDSLKAILVFPYTSGLRFVHSILRKGGYQALDAVYRDPPASSREILHPDEYLAHTVQLQIPAPHEVPGAAQNRAPEYTDVLGEFSISSLFANSAKTRGKGVQAAVGWLGDRIAIFPKNSEGREVVWITRWQSEADATEFYETYRDFIQDRYGVTVAHERKDLTPTKSVAIERASQSVVIHVLSR